MVAFVDDQVAVIADEISDHALADETLNDALRMELADELSDSEACCGNREAAA